MQLHGNINSGKGGVAIMHKIHSEMHYPLQAPSGGHSCTFFVDGCMFEFFKLLKVHTCIVSCFRLD